MFVFSPPGIWTNHRERIVIKIVSKSIAEEDGSHLSRPDQTRRGNHDKTANDDSRDKEAGNNTINYRGKHVEYTNALLRCFKILRWLPKRSTQGTVKWNALVTSLI